MPYKKKLKEKIFEGEIFSESHVKSSTISNKKIQNLNFSIAGLHEKSCVYALKTLSLYESYSKLLDFVKESTYNEKTQELNFQLKHVLLPYDMLLIFKLPRITKEGAYPFVFEQGILKDLKGTIYAINYQNRCLFYSTAAWAGPSTGFPDIIFEFFSQTLAKLTMEKLFRISSTLSH
ncbi:MAG: hypothetical protein H7336_00715 [Bacteriovorax sp.]|nr:hypothetical protein [Bacteriovorax sp.]